MRYLYIVFLSIYFLFSISFGEERAHVLSYDFEDGLDGWTIGDDTEEWKYSENHATNYVPPSGSKFIFIDDYGDGPGAYTNAYATTPAINLSGCENVRIGGRFLFHDTPWVEKAVFTLRYLNTSGSWNPLVTFSPTDNEWREFEFALPQEACHSNARITFNYHDVNEHNLWAALDDIYIDIPATAVPGPASVQFPENNDTDISISTTLEWSEVYNVSGYKLYAGENNPPNTINGEDLGMATSFKVAGLLAGTTYYWQIVPYNEAGDAVDCPVWSFTTVPDYWSAATISPLVINQEVAPEATSSRNITIDNSGANSFAINYKTKIQYENKSFDFKGSGAYAFGSDGTFFNFDIDNPAEQTEVSSISGSYFAADFVPSSSKVMYGLRSDDNKLYKIFINVGEEQEIGDCPCPVDGGVWTDFACNKLSGEMYATATNGTISKLYTIDLNNGNSSEIGEMTGSPGAIALAIDRSGDAYSYDIVYNKSYKVSLETAAVIELGPTGFQGIYAQSMACDPETNNIYLTSYAAIDGETSAQLRLLDKETGATTVLATLPQQTYGFGFPGSIKNWLTLSAPEGNVPANSIANIELTIDAAGWEVDTEKRATIVFYDENNVPYADLIQVTMTATSSDISENLSKSILLFQNYPNPFNPVTQIKFDLSDSNFKTAEILVYNSAGQQVWQRSVATMQVSSLQFNGTKFDSGIYYYSLVLDGKKMSTKKMLMVK